MQPQVNSDKMESSIRILSTKKLAGNHKQYLLNAGFGVLEADFINTVGTSFEIKELPQNMIFTSQNAVKSFLETQDVPTGVNKAFCVGSKTKELLIEKGFNVVAFADYAEDLAEIIIKNHPAEEFIFFSGSMRRDTLPDALERAGVKFTETKVYKTVLTPHKIDVAVSGILFFSPSGVESFLKKNDIKNAVCFCIGATTAKALKGITENIVIANRPSVENVIIQCINYYKNTAFLQDS